MELSADFAKMTCEQFLEELASARAVPGGGGASALAGAVGIALGCMVANLTVGKTKYAPVQAELLELREKADLLRAELLWQIQRDAEAFLPLSLAYAMPAQTEEQRREKLSATQEALALACTAPLRIMELCCEAITLHKTFAEKGSALVVSDAGVGAALCRAALNGAALNVFVNTKAMADTTSASSINVKAGEMLSQYTQEADAIYSYVTARLL